MRIVTWNVNSIRARHPGVLAWLTSNHPDVMALQETKCTDDAFAEVAEDYAMLGYDSLHWGRGHWNGVAILSRIGIREGQRGFRGVSRPPYDEARLLTATCGHDTERIRLSSVCVPNGRELDSPHYLSKLVWLERLRAEVASSRRRTCCSATSTWLPADVPTSTTHPGGGAEPTPHHRRGLPSMLSSAPG